MAACLRGLRKLSVSAETRAAVGVVLAGRGKAVGAGEGWEGVWEAWAEEGSRGLFN